MPEKVNEKVSVVSLYDTVSGLSLPKKIKWRGREYHIEKLGYHHKVRQGRTLLHIFEVATETAAFRLCLDTDTLIWRLEEVYDELAAQP